MRRKALTSSFASDTKALDVGRHDPGRTPTIDSISTRIHWAANPHAQYEQAGQQAVPRREVRNLEVRHVAWVFSRGHGAERDRTYVRVFELHLPEEQRGLHAGKREGNVPSRQSAESERAHVGERGPTYEVNPRKNTVTSPKTYPHSATTPGSRQSTMARPRQSPQNR